MHQYYNDISLFTLSHNTTHPPHTLPPLFTTNQKIATMNTCITTALTTFPSIQHAFPHIIDTYSMPLVNFLRTPHTKRLRQPMGDHSLSSNATPSNTHNSQSTSYHPTHSHQYHHTPHYRTILYTNTTYYLLVLRHTLFDLRQTLVAQSRPVRDIVCSEFLYQPQVILLCHYPVIRENITMPSMYDDYAMKNTYYW